MTTVRELTQLLDGMFPPALAEEWDAVGLAVGDSAAKVERVLFAVDPTLAVAREAIERGVQLLVTHHPLMLRGVTSVAADTLKGSVVQLLIANGVALYSAHTNADAAAGGVNDALAAAFGVTATAPLVPEAADATCGQGRVGTLAEPVSLRDFAQRVVAALPHTAHGVRVAGDLEAPVSRVAIMGGSGGDFLDAARATGADVYVTADLRHHTALDARELALLGDGRPALVDVSHYASEWLWLQAAADAVAGATGADTHVSNLVTDPWTARFGADRDA